MSQSFYDAMAPWYDLEFDEFDADVDLYRGYAEVVGSPLLELGCGTGRLLVPLAEAGYQITGIDSSTEMLDQARRRLDRVQLDVVDLRQLDMRALGSLPASHFQMVFCAVNTFLHLETRQDQLFALTGIQRLLKSSGIFIVDLFHPTPATLSAMDDRLQHDAGWTLADGTRIDRFSQRRVAPAQQLIETTLFVDRTSPDGIVHRSVGHYQTRYVHHFEMLGLLEVTGFELEGVYGSYDLEPLDDQSPNMIFVAHAR
ncbi:MAG TPA: class I SAM-dependent methyltransferase [Nitrolancea sp.]|nr:class I SAM-dependent methyltransferase [Nitrolancea sp.]